MRNKPDHQRRPGHSLCALDGKECSRAEGRAKVDDKALLRSGQSAWEEYMLRRQEDNLIERQRKKERKEGRKKEKGKEGRKEGKEEGRTTGRQAGRQTIWVNLLYNIAYNNPRIISFNC